ncbi:MAG: alpha/beta hydrolase, partial [Acidimicrobiales bacterium]
MEQLTVVNGDVRLEVFVQGEGPVILLLHGWPDTSIMWDEVTPDLVAAGYRVAVPDLRGCGQSDKPAELTSYAMHHLIGDIANIVEALGVEKVTVVGHDWGAALAWGVALTRPDLVERIVVVSV